VKRPRIVERLADVISGSLHTRGVVLWTAALATGILCVWQHVYSLHLAAEIEELRIRREEINAEIGFVAMECAVLSSRARIERYARERLGMRYPDGGEVVRLEANRDPVGSAWHDEFVERGSDGIQDG